MFFIVYEIFFVRSEIKIHENEKFFYLKNFFCRKKKYFETNEILSVLTEIFWYNWNIFQFY